MKNDREYLKSIAADLEEQSRKLPHIVREIDEAWTKIESARTDAKYEAAGEPSPEQVDRVAEYLFNSCDPGPKLDYPWKKAPDLYHKVWRQAASAAIKAGLDWNRVPK